MPTYVFKKWQEIAWVAFVGAGVFALTVLIDFDPEKIQDWRTWAIALGGGCVRAAVGAILAVLRPI